VVVQGVLAAIGVLVAGIAVGPALAVAGVVTLAAAAFVLRAGFLEVS
jgi:hypothetical protein